MKSPTKTTTNLLWGKPDLSLYPLRTSMATEFPFQQSLQSQLSWGVPCFVMENPKIKWMRTRGLPILENLYIIISIIGIEKLLGNG
jgi:hypothetical protein